MMSKSGHRFTSKREILKVNNLNISKTKRDCEKLKAPFRLIYKCCSVVFKIGSKIFSLQWHFKCLVARWIFPLNLLLVSAEKITQYHVGRKMSSGSCSLKPSLEACQRQSKCMSKDIVYGGLQVQNTK